MTSNPDNELPGYFQSSLRDMNNKTWGYPLTVARLQFFNCLKNVGATEVAPVPAVEIGRPASDGLNDNQGWLSTAGISGFSLTRSSTVVFMILGIETKRDALSSTASFPTFLRRSFDS